jgi:predicted MFS family arabinose efflux permease
MFQALRIRDFRLLWAGGTISYLGSWLLVLAVPAHVFLTTRSLAAAGLTLAAEYLPLLLLGPVAGVLTDRGNRRMLLIGTNFFRAAAVAAMLFALGPGRYWIFYAALLAESSATAIAVPAQQARTPAIVGTGRELTSANSLNALSSGLVGVLGGPLGGILLATLGIEVLIVADVISYLVAAIAIMMTTREQDKRHSAGPSGLRTIVAELSEGLGILRREPTTRALLAVSVIFLTANASLTGVVVPFALDRLGGSEPTGFLYAALSVGYLLGAPLLKLTLDRISPRWLLFGTLDVTAGGYLLLFHSSSLVAALPAGITVGMFGSMALVVPQTLVQRLIPNAALGRVSAVFLTGEAAATLIGAGVGPALAQTVGIATLAAAASLATITAALLAVGQVPRSPERT